MKERVQYIDVAKFLGIFAIYLGHFGTLAGATILLCLNITWSYFSFYQDVPISMIMNRIFPTIFGKDSKR